jgi:hypothetical protein
VDNGTSGLEAYVDQQLATARGGGASDPTLGNEQDASGTDQTPFAAADGSASDALSGTELVPEGETAPAPDPDGATSAAPDDSAAIQEELQRLRADAAERDRKELESRQAQLRAEDSRRQQEIIQRLEQSFGEFEQYENGLGAKAKSVAAIAVNTALQEFQPILLAAQRAADENGRAASALYHAIQSTRPELLAGFVEVAKSVLPLNSPEEQGNYFKTVNQRVSTATADLQAENARLKAQLKQTNLQNQARGIIDGGTLGVGTGGGNGQVVSSDAPTNFSEWFDQKRSQAVAGAR